MKSPPDPGARRAMPAGAERWMQIALAAAIAAMTCYLGFRHYRRADLTRSAYYSISGKTVAVLGGLTSPLDVLVFIDPERSDLYDDVQNLLREYADASRWVQVQYISPYRNPARTEEIFSRYDVSRQEDVVVFEYEGRQKYIRDYELAEFDYTEAGALGGEPTMRSFSGEQVFTSAILALTSSGQDPVHFLTGHREKSIENFDDDGLATLAKFLRRENLEPVEVSLANRESLPGDCRLLVIAGPEVPLAGWETVIIREFLRRDGRLLVLLDPMRASGLEALLAEWGVEVGNDIVVEPIQIFGMEAVSTELNVFNYPFHPINREMGDQFTSFSYVRSVRPASESDGDGDGDADRPTVSILATTTPRGWSERNLSTTRSRFDNGEDLPGPIPIAVAAELGALPGLDVDVGSSRAVVFGDSDFVSTGIMTQSNLDLFLGAVNWLLDRESLIAIGPKTREEFRLVMSPAQLRNIFVGCVVGLPLVVFLVGAQIWWSRRR